MELGRRSSGTFASIHLVNALIAHPSNMMVRTTTTWVNIAMDIIWRKKKATNLKVQHTHNAMSRPPIVKIMIRSLFVSGRTPGIKKTSTSTLNHLVTGVTTPVHGLACL
jgi:hypothetical protein